MSAPKKPESVLSSSFVKMKVNALRDKSERKKACEAYLARLEAQRAAQKRSRSQVDDTDVCIRWLKLELEHLNKK